MGDKEIPALPFEPLLGRLAYDALLIVIAPLFPGGTFLAGAAILGVVPVELQDLWAQSAALGSTFQIFVLFLAAYVVGVCIFLVAQRLTHFVIRATAIISHRFAKHDNRPPPEWPSSQPWKNAQFREAAGRFLGSLAPAEKLSFDLDAWQKEMPRVPTDTPEYEAEMSKFEAKNEEFNAKMREYDENLRKHGEKWNPIKVADKAWLNWYQVLQVYFMRRRPSFDDKLTYLWFHIVVTSVGYTGLLLLALAGKQSHWYWTLAIAVILLGTFGAANENVGLPSTLEQPALIADILRELRSSSANKGCA